MVLIGIVCRRIIVIILVIETTFKHYLVEKFVVLDVRVVWVLEKLRILMRLLQRNKVGRFWHNQKVFGSS